MTSVLTRERIAGGLAALAGLALVGAAATIVVRSTWLTPAAALREDIAAAKASLNTQRRALREADEVAGFLDEFAARGLGTTREEVDHGLRTHVADLADRAGIPGAIVSTRGQRVLSTPMRSAFPRRGIWRELRDQPDLAELSASVSGEATLPQALELLAQLSAATWPHRIDGFRLDPRRGGERLGFRVDITTAYLPDRPRRAEAAAALAAAGPAEPSETVRTAVMRLAAADRFRLPQPEPEPAPAPPPVRVVEAPPPPGPPPFPWGRWQLTGVADGPAGREAWLRRTDNGTRAVLAMGDAFQDVTLLAVEEDAVVLAIGDERIRITIGDSLSAAGRAR
jgi:hypothetical protein